MQEYKPNIKFAEILKYACACAFSVFILGCSFSPAPTYPAGARVPDKASRTWATQVTRAEISPEGLNYRIFVPAGIGFFEKVPLVFFLHGAGERGEDNSSQLRWAMPQLISYSLRKKTKAIIVAPQCPKDHRWFETPWNEINHPSTPDPGPTMAKVISLLEQMIEEYPVDANRVYLTGISMGGYGTWDLAVRRPELFAAALPVCGGGDISKASELSSLPIMTVHGDKDASVPVENSRLMVSAVRAAGGNVIYEELKGAGHGVWGYTYGTDRILDWLFSRHR